MIRFSYLCVGCGIDPYIQKGETRNSGDNSQRNSDSSLISEAPIMCQMAPPPSHPPLLWGPSIYIHPHPFIFPATLYIYTHHTFNRANTSSSSFSPFFLSFFLGGFLMELVTLLMRERARETCWS
jgi:hypothetical protein